MVAIDGDAQIKPVDRRWRERGVQGECVRRDVLVDQGIEWIDPGTALGIVGLGGAAVETLPAQLCADPVRQVRAQLYEAGQAVILRRQVGTGPQCNVTG